MLITKTCNYHIWMIVFHSKALSYYWNSALFPLTPKSSWIISVELAIGPEEGISYLTDKGANVSLLLFCGFFSQVTVLTTMTCCEWDVSERGVTSVISGLNTAKLGALSMYSSLSQININLWFGIKGKALVLGTETVSASALNLLAFPPSEVLTCRIWSIGVDFLPVKRELFWVVLFLRNG